ncbi:MAG: translation initiation factor IF-3 [Bacteroidetes bacterium]|nr:translation initiation factor IF-3 [Bacteroidota bacterium]
MAKGHFNRNFSRPPEPKFRINEQIRIPEIRLVGENLEEVSTIVGETIEPGSIVPTRKALFWADKAQLDLIEISPNAAPPVCRLTDFNKYLYEKKRKEKEMKAKASKTVLKEIRFGPNTDDHDFEFKTRHAKNFLEESSKVKAYVHFFGRTIVFKDRGRDLLERFVKELEEVGTPEAPIKLEGKRMIVVLTPKKKKA